MAYIERETALKIIDNYANTVTEDGKVIVDAIRDIVAVITPTADVVEVVRCKDCVHKVDFKGRVMCNRNATKFMNERLGLSATDNNHYCSYGERKTPKGE